MVGRSVKNPAAMMAAFEAMARDVRAHAIAYPELQTVHVALDSVTFYGERYPRNYVFDVDGDRIVRLFLKPVIGLMADTGSGWIVSDQEWTDLEEVEPGDGNQDNDNSGGGDAGPDAAAGGRQPAGDPGASEAGDGAAGTAGDRA